MGDYLNQVNKYVHKQKPIKAQRWRGHGFDFSLIDVEQRAGLSGYSAKLGYFCRKNGERKTVRPNEILIQNEHGDISVMLDEEFSSKYYLLDESEATAVKKVEDLEAEIKFLKAKINKMNRPVDINDKK